MRAVEWIVIAYLGYVAILALARRHMAEWRVAILIVVVVDTSLLVWLSGAAASSPVLRVLRDWIPAAQVLMAYWLSGPFFQAPMPRVEAWLLSVDRWWFDRAGLAWLAARGPRWLLELLEAAYVSAYALVPLGFGAAYLASGGTLDADRYWTPVIAAELLCYGALPWIQTRTPGALGDRTYIDGRSVTVRRLNRLIQRRASIQVNTFPSGHAAGAIATALAAGAVVPELLLPLIAAALAITLGSVVGRYHYMADGLAGLAVGLAVSGIG
jgi:hypothetical protein